MKCPFCGEDEDKVVDSRSSKNGLITRRRRECLKCNKRFTTYEQIEEVQLSVIKNDGRREAFDRNKIISGMKKACEKRPISVDVLEDAALEIERDLQNSMDKEIPSSVIGEKVVMRLKEMDDVAYVRFASVYRHFRGVDEFMDELKKLLINVKNKQ